MYYNTQHVHNWHSCVENKIIFKIGVYNDWYSGNLCLHETLNMKPLLKVKDSVLSKINITWQHRTSNFFTTTYVKTYNNTGI